MRSTFLLAVEFARRAKALSIDTKWKYGMTMLTTSTCLHTG